MLDSRRNTMKKGNKFEGYIDESGGIYNESYGKI